MKALSLLLFQNNMFIYLLLFISIYVLILYYLFKPKQINTLNENKINLKQFYFVKNSLKNRKLNKLDIFFILLISGIYAIICLCCLGSFKIPNTYWQPYDDDTSVVIKVDSDKTYDTISLIGGEGDNNNNLDTYQIGMKDINIYGSNDDNEYILIHTISDYSFMQYYSFLVDTSYSYIKIEVDNKNQVINEIGIFNSNDKQLLPLSIYHDDYNDTNYPASLLIDEQDKFNTDPTYMDETYFDEIYHVRNAIEIVNGQFMYPSVHPLLGTNIIAFFILLFGNNPFAWRIGGVLFSIAMLPIVYLLSKRLFNTTRYCTISTLLFALDFMHLTTARIATLEPFSIFFIILMYYFMSLYFYTSFLDTKFLQQLIYLLACGISTSLAIATKWTGCYSAVGIAIIFFINFGTRIKEYLIAKKKFKQKIYVDNIEEKLCHKIINYYPRYLIITIIFNILVFILLPILTYLFVHIIDHIWRDSFSISNMIKQIQYTYNYHINLQATHPFQSQWYQWILNIRPIWYYIKRIDNYAYSITCMSHPLITLACFSSLIYSIYLYIRHKAKITSLTIIFIGFLSALLPWMLVQRCVFAYHFYPSTLFYILILVYMIRYLELKYKTYKITKIFIIVSIIIFIIFLPATCGFETYQSYLNGFLTWLPSWNLN